MNLTTKLLRPLGSGIAMGVPFDYWDSFQRPHDLFCWSHGSFFLFGFSTPFIQLQFKSNPDPRFCIVECLYFRGDYFIDSLECTVYYRLLILHGFLLSKIYRLPKPDYFFVLMLYATGFNFHHQTQNVTAALLAILHQSSYLLYGIVGSLAAGLLISAAERLPFHLPKDRFQQLSLKDKYYVALYHQPEMFLKAMHFSMILFIATYSGYLLRASNGYWILISAAAVLAGEHMENIKKEQSVVC